MASVCDDGNGKRRVIVTVPDGKRIAFKGRWTARQAETMARNLDDLVTAHLAGERPSTATAEWLGKLPDRMHRRLVRAGLAQARVKKESPTLAAWIAGYIGGRTDAEPSTVCNMRQAERTLVEHLGAGKLLVDVTAADADSYRVFLCGKLSEATVRRQSGRARQFFNAAVRARLLVENPFRHLQSADFINPDRRHDVTQGEIDGILREASSIDLKLAVALSYYAGLRTPSESCRLTWGDVDFARSVLQVRAMKTKRHGGNSALREVPIAPPLANLLLDAYHRAPEGAEKIITRYDGRANLRTELVRAMVRAGVEPFDKPFVNMRATCETNWLALGVPEYQVSQWIGHQVKIGRRHYDLARQEYADRVTGQAAEKGAQKRAQQTTDMDRKGSPATEDPANCGRLQTLANQCVTSTPRLGLEPRT